VSLEKLERNVFFAFARTIPIFSVSPAVLRWYVPTGWWVLPQVRYAGKFLDASTGVNRFSPDSRPWYTFLNSREVCLWYLSRVAWEADAKYGQYVQCLPRFVKKIHVSTSNRGSPSVT
jgi:hypothetical protein